MIEVKQEIIDFILSIDFFRQKRKMAYPIELSGTGWSEKMIDEVEIKYKKWLVLVYKNRDKVEKIGFDMEIDWFWHHHILDTVAYVEFCKKVFGFYLHHDPYAGMQDEDITMQDLKENYETYAKLSEETH